MKNILITGSRSGIIKDVIYKIINNYNIYITVHTLKEQKIVEELYKNYKNIKCFKLDVTNKNDIKKLYDINIDILICNAAVMESGSILDIPLKNIKKCFDVNFFGNIEIISKVIKKEKNIKVIVISSLASIIPIPFDGAYCCSKAALSHMMRCLNLETKLTDKKIDIVTIEPGLYATGFNEYGFLKKYDYMDIDSFFNNQIDSIRRGENIILKLFQKKNLNSISNKIVKAIKSDNPKLFYRSPISQVIFSKIYKFFS